MTSDTSNDYLIHMETVSAPTNIACIKYWGKASIELNTPINSSISVTLDQSDLRAITTASASRSFKSNRLWLNGVEEDVSKSKRFNACLEGVRSLATDKIDEATGEVTVKAEEWKDMHVHVSSYNTFPTAAGLASSAAGYAALVAAFARLFNAKEEFPNQLSTFARQGSGSACRSLYGGFVAWRMGSDTNNSLAEQVADEHHWPDIRALILVVSDAKKDTSSTSGMSTSVNTSKLLSYRATNIVPERMKIIEKAFLDKDFQTFANITMADSNQFHATCLDTFPPIFYLNDVSRSIIKVIHAYNKWAGEVRAGYTFDAGPNAVIYTLQQYSLELSALMLHFYPAPQDNQDSYFNNKNLLDQISSYQLDPSLIQTVESTGRDINQGDVKMIYFTKSGPGPLHLSSKDALIDKTTGLNIYQP